MTAISNDASSSSCVQVAVRVRPMLASEAGSTQCIEVLRGQDSDEPNCVRIGGASGPTFAFDQAFGGPSLQGHVYERSVAPLVESCVEGYNATCVAYGQTGSGKTHTIMGPSTSIALHDEITAGVIPRAMRRLFEQLEQTRQFCNASNKENQPDTLYEYEVRIQFLELYGEEIRDLLTPSSCEPLTIRDVGLDNEPEVMGATRHKVESAEEALLCLTRGMMRRVTGATAMNSSSSRSHAILSVLVEQTTTLKEQGDSEQTHHEHVQCKRSKFNFVDLAGSERQKRTKAEGQRLKEGIDINKGLLVLGNVISALGDPKKAGKSFVPYRDSKLTRLLKGSLGGNHKTLMIACVSPSSSNLDESLNCLRYANRAKNIQNNAVVNVDSGSRLVDELRQQVQALAIDLLRTKEGDYLEGSFTIETLKSLATGSDSAGLLPGSSVRPARHVPLPKENEQREPQQTKNVERELDRTREELRRAKVEVLTTSEALHVTKAEKELYRLQLAATTGEASDKDVHQVFLERSAAYEKEIASLKEAVRKASIPVELEFGDVSSPRAQRDKLLPAASALSPTPPETATASDTNTLESPELSRLHCQVLQSLSHSDQLEAEEHAETAEITTITSKYLDGDVDDDDDDLSSGVQVNQNLSVEGELGGNAIEGSLRQTQQMEAHLLEISRSIEAKEDLINQLQLSQEKYATMRDFYENKLHEMEEQVREKESERDQLIIELQKMEVSNSCTRDLEQELTKRTEHIALLRKKHKELVTLTNVSSTNESEICRLRVEVVKMKQKKVDLQKFITSERKNHAAEILRLKKDAMQRDREANKWKKLSDKKAAEADNAYRVAKAKQEEIIQLRLKYKEAERKLRVRTVKRGVMEKAGLDPVIVGRRNSQPRNSAPRSIKGRENGTKDVNFDAVREFLDQKIAEVGRKEKIADKLANEWEDHLELVSQKEELSRQLENGNAVTSSDSLDALDIQIQYKEERIRHLSRRLGKVERNTKGDSLDDAFLQENGLKSILADKSPLATANVAARVLFGMVVRERRRIASLARTASSLDEKVLELEKSLLSKDAALRSYMEEERRQRESLAQSQQEQILSLMTIVQKHETASSTNGKTDAIFNEAENMNNARDDHPANASILVLANERISAMQSQLEELQREREALETYKEKEAEALSLLSSKEEDCSALRKELNSMRTSLRQVREIISRQDCGAVDVEESDHPTHLPSEADQSILAIVMEALHPSRSGSSTSRKRKNGSAENSSALLPKPFSPRMKRHVELMHTSDSEEDGEVPDWAGDVMKDLALIAEGGVPPSLQTVDPVRAFSRSPGRDRKTATGNVFDRLTHPDNFTGVQKRRVRDKRIKSAPTATSLRSGQAERRAITRLVSESLDKVVIPDETSSFLPSDQRKVSSSSAVNDDTGRSVFDRLVSPSNYTGTHKGKAQRSGSHGEHGESDGPDAVLEMLLANDAEGSSEVPFLDHHGDSHEQFLSNKISEYTQRDVFERLQQTTTEAYAKKTSRENK